MKDDIYAELLIWLNGSTQRAMEHFMQFIREQGLTIQQMNLLMYLYYHGSQEITHLVEPLQVGKSAISQMVERLVQQNLLERVEAPGDRRVRLLQISDEARQLIHAGIKARQSWLNHLPDSLSVKEQQNMLQALKTLNQIYDMKQTGPP